MTNGKENLMLSINDNSFDDDAQSKVSAVVAGILVVIAGFMVYNYFSSTDQTIKEEGAPQAEELVLNNEELQNLDGASKKEVMGSNTELGFGGEAPEGTWMPRDIAADTISAEDYTVQAGDTLWEIAEGRYGTGFDWHKILEANKDSVGFLPNGSQALIEIGQVLNLP